MKALIFHVVALTGIALTCQASSFASNEAAQQAFGSDTYDRDGFPQLNFSSPSPQIFHSMFSLLQQWPNTYFPNGHTIAPGILKRNTNLYHARVGAQLPPSPEWFGLDAEMSYWIAGTWPNSHLLTYRTTRDVQVLYFDGTSAALMGEGSMDSQMLLLYNASGNVPEPPRSRRPPRPPPDHDPREDAPPIESAGESSFFHYPDPGEGGNRTLWNPLQEEYDRAAGLCNFMERKGLGGLGWGYEGVVRMNAAFEVIWCNFSSPSIKLISHLNVSAPQLSGVKDSDGWPGRPPQRGSRLAVTGFGDPPREGVPHNGASMQPGNNNPFRDYAGFDWFRVATQRYGLAGREHGRGETRVVVESCALFTFYDPILLDQSGARVLETRKVLNLTEEGFWQGPPAHDGDRDASLMRLTRRQRFERSRNVSAADGETMLRLVERRMRLALYGGHHECSGIDWIETSRDIVVSYSARLRGLKEHLTVAAKPSSNSTLREMISNIRDLTHSLWMPFYEYPSYRNSTLATDFHARSPTSQAALKRCEAQSTPVDLHELGEGDRTAFAAVSDVLAAICGTTLPAYLEIEQLWLAHFNNVSNPGPPTHIEHRARRSMQRSAARLEVLMAWLGWIDQWTGCDPGCSQDQVCFIPIWPLLMDFRRRPHNETRASRDGTLGFWDNSDKFLWEPTCVDAEHYPPQ